MIADLKPYSEYKVSDQDWFGSVPLHWSVLPNRAIFEEVKDRNHPDEEMLSVTITRGIVRQKTLLANSSKKDSSNLNKSAYKLVQPHDIAYNKMRAWQGAIGVSNFRGIISPAYVVMRLRKSKNLPRYFHHLYRTPMFAKEAERWSYGITSDMWSLRPEHFKMIYTPEPPEEEQATIVRFLNWVNNRLGRAIKAKQKQIVLLNEQKQAIIHRAVIRGLDPSITLKPSGIPWLGEIPSHWMVRRIRQIVVVKPAKSESINELRRNSVVTFLPMENVKTDSTIDATLQVPAADVCNGFTYFRRGDVIVAKITPCFENGKGAYLEKLPTEVGFGSTEFHVLRPGPKILGAYLRLVTASKQFLDNGTNSMTGSAGQQRVSTDFIKNYPIALPEVTEQQEILDSVERSVSKIGIGVSSLEHEIELLKEYRTCLVADVVTGKFDVREAAAKLPEEEIEEIAEASEDMESAEEEIAV